MLPTHERCNLLRKHIAFLHAITSIFFFPFKSIVAKHEQAWQPTEEPR